MEIKSFYNSRLNEKMQYTVHSSGLRVYVFPKKGFSKDSTMLSTERSTDRLTEFSEFPVRIK